MTNTADAPAAAPLAPAQKTLIMASIMTAVTLSAIDATIATVALPHMQGSLSAGQDQITWVLTSYIIAQTLSTPLVSWVAERVGRKNLLMICVAGFTLASMACGIAVNLPQMVLFRILQGIFCAAFMPMAQSIMFDINEPKDHAKASAIFGMGVMVGPIFGPILGGYLTDALNWRWCFLINLPIGIVALVGLWSSLPGKTESVKRSFDIMGFSFLALFLANLQLILDRGPGQDWFSAQEIWIYTALSSMGLYLFVVHTFTAKAPFFSPSIFADRNFVIGTSLSFLFGALVFSSSAQFPTMLQSLLGLSAYDAGMVLAPRGLGMMLAMIISARIAGRVNFSIMIAGGFLTNAVTMWVMSHLSLQTDTTPIVWWGFILGFGTGFVFVAVNTITFATIPGALRPEAAGVYTLMRYLGMAIGISGMQATLVHNMSVMHSNLAAHASIDNPIFSMIPAFNLDSIQGRIALDAEMMRQSLMIGYIDDFTLSIFLSLLAVPLAFMLQKPSKSASQERVEVHVE